MLCDPAAFQAHVTVLPAGIVSTAAFWLPLWALRKKMLPTTTCPTAPPPPPPPPGDVMPPPHAAREKRVATMSRAVYRIRPSMQGDWDCAMLAIAPRWKYQTRSLGGAGNRSEEHTSELQSLRHLVCRLLLE